MRKPRDLRGRSLLPAAAVAPPPRPVWSETDWGRLRAGIVGPFKIILNLDSQQVGYFDVVHDAGETNNLIRRRYRPRVGESYRPLRAALDAWRMEMERAVFEAPEVALSDETTRQLRALGYFALTCCGCVPLGDSMRTLCSLSIVIALTAALDPAVRAAQPPLLPPGVGAAIAEEISGEAAKRTVEALALEHRMRGSRGLHAAAEYVSGELRRAGLSAVEIVEIPADGTTFYGTQRSRRPWDAEFAELWEMARAGDGWRPARRWASWETEPLTLAQDSESADVEAELVDVGAGTAERDYAGRDVRGKIVLASSQPEAVVALAVDRFGAAGIVSYAQNQRTAWWGEDENLVRWGHVGSFNPRPSFAFMASLKTARAFQKRLAAGEAIRLHATVRAGQHAGHYDVVTATLPGADPAHAGEEIAFSCHLDHPRPGANDNASGCATQLEIARALAKLVREEKLPAPRRTLRFVFPPEIEGTESLLNFRPALQTSIKAAIHLDMVGGGQQTKAVFHVTRGPASLPSFVHDVAAEFGEFVNRESLDFAMGQPADYPLVAPEGGKEALLAQLSDYTAGSDHDVYQDSSFSIPAIYFNDWPDRYIHTNFDLPAHVDPTKLRRAGFIAAASGWLLANFSDADAAAIARLLERRSLQRAARTLERREGLGTEDAAALTRFALAYERATYASLDRFLGPAGTRRAGGYLDRLPAILGGEPRAAAAPAGDGAVVYRRNQAVKGPVSVFGYDYLADHIGEERAGKLALPSLGGGHGANYAYEALNLVDGTRCAAEIRAALTAIYGPVSLADVTEYLRALAEAGLITLAAGR